MAAITATAGGDSRQRPRVIHVESIWLGRMYIMLVAVSDERIVD